MDILYLAVIDWHFIRQRIQHLAAFLSKRHQVIYVYPRTVIRYLRLFRQKKSSLNLDLSISREINHNLELYHPLILPQYKSRVIGKINRALFLFLLKRFLRKRDFRPSVLWVTHPTHVNCVELFPVDLVCYDCVDNWPDFLDGKRSQEIREKEIYLLSRADLVIVTSHALQKRMQNQTKDVYLVPNGVEAEHFSSAILDDLPIPADIRGLQKPLIGYVGTVATWLDFDLILYAAEKRETYNFVFVGPLGGINTAKYNHIKNLYFLNSRPYQVLPNYMKHMDVMILPFKVNKLTESVDPIKAYEYLAAGKQVVATEMPELYKFENLIRIAESKYEFVDLLDESLHEIKSGKHNPQIRLERILDHTWMKRGEQVEKVLVRYLRSKAKRFPVDAG
jgi:glycosyltransferase involved in cell wall biosynthesis